MRGCKCRWGEGGIGGLTDFESGSVMRLEDELVCCFKLVVNVVRGGVWQFVYDTNRPAFLEREGFIILSSDPSTQDLLTKPPSVTFQKPHNHHQLIVDTSLCPHRLPTLQ